MSDSRLKTLLLMAGPKFDLEWEFGTRLEGMSQFSFGHLITTSSDSRSLRIGGYEITAVGYHSDSRISALWTRFVYICKCVQTMRACRRSGQPVKLVLTYDPLLTGLIGYLLAKTFGAALICEVNGDYTNPASFSHIRSATVRALKRWITGKLVRFVLRHAAGIRTLFQEQLANLGYQPGPSQVVAQIPEFVNTNAFRNLGEERTVLLVGFPFLIKGVDIAIAAFKRVAGDFPDWRLKIIGHYPDSRELDSAIGDCVAITHHRAVRHREMNEHIGRCAILLQPSRTEAMGRVLVEAMAAGKPRIASNVGGIPTVVENGTDGILVESEDIDGFAAALSSLMRSEELRRSLGRAGAIRAKEQLAPEKYFQRVARLFRAVADERSLH